MKRSIPLMILFLSAICCFSGCNDDNETWWSEEYTSTNVAVTEFRLGENDSILANLDTVFFAIDLDNARIWNPDSLPVGTRTNRLQISPTFGSVSVAEIHCKTDAGVDTIINYFTNPDDSVNFEAGPVILRLTSFDGTVSCDYRIEVNVHSQQPDSLSWTEIEKFGLPTLTTDNWGTTLQGDVLYLLSLEGAKGTLYNQKTDQIGLVTGSISSLTLPDGADCRTLVSTEEAMYLLADGKLYETTTGWQHFRDCGVAMDYIYGVQGNQVVGAVRNADGSWNSVTYPGGKTVALDSEMPVGETSRMITYVSQWSTEPMSVIVGGTKADGSLTGDCWGFSAGKWARLSSTKPVPALKGLTVFPYFIYSTSSTWVVTENSVLFAVGGADSDGNISDKTYYSRDRGISWSESGRYLQFPESVKPRRDARAYVIDRLFRIDPNGNVIPPSRYSQPVTEWEAPYVYIIGGYEQGEITQSASVIRGVINRMTYKPLY
ncbi:MAG: DUF6242 domain-containing protein [Clostridium sp.]|nr:DUF6242 domain-containing protein [Clostridium sp.]